MSGDTKGRCRDGLGDAATRGQLWPQLVADSAYAPSHTPVGARVDAHAAAVDAIRNVRAADATRKAFAAQVFGDAGAPSPPSAATGSAAEPSAGSSTSGTSTSTVSGGLPRFPLLGVAPAAEAALCTGSLPPEERHHARVALCVLSQMHDLRYCPQLPFLATRLWRPADAAIAGAPEGSVQYAMLQRLLTLDECPLFRSRYTAHSFHYAFMELLRGRAASAAAVVEPIRDASFAVFEEAFAQFLLPWVGADNALRVIDVFLSEGPKVLLRLAVAFLKGAAKSGAISASACGDAVTLRAALVAYGHADTFDFDALSKAAFKLRSFSKATIADLQKRFRTLRSASDYAADPEPQWFHPQLSVADEKASATLVSRTERELLYPLLVGSAAEACNHRLLYTTEAHGWGPESMYSRTDKAAPVLLVIEARLAGGDGAAMAGAASGTTVKIGAYLSEPLRPSRKGWVGLADCFVFTMTPTVAAFRRAGTGASAVAAPVATAGAGAGDDGYVMVDPADLSEPPVDAAPALADSDDSKSKGARETFTPEAVVAAAAEAAPMMCMITRDMIAVGGNSTDATVALRLTEDFTHGDTAACALFGSPPLVGGAHTDGEVRFSCSCVEVYGFIASSGRLLTAA